MDKEELNHRIIACLNSDEGREELGETMVMPLLSQEAREQVRARREAIKSGCVEVKEEREK